MQNWLICKCNDIMVRKAGIGHLLGTTALIKIASGKERSIEHLIRVFHARDNVLFNLWFCTEVNAHNNHVKSGLRSHPWSETFLSVSLTCSGHLPARFSSSICRLRSSSTPSLVFQCASNPSTSSLTPLISFSTPFNASPVLLLPSPLSSSRISFRL